MEPTRSSAVAPSHPSGLTRYLPILNWLPHYDRSWLRFDIIAGLTTWALVVPQGIAYAQIAGLPPEAGLYTAFAAMLGYALFGTSRQLVVSPASATAAVSAALVGPLALGDGVRFASLSALLAIMVGIAFFVYGLLKLGFISQFIATAVQAGLMFGLGLQIIAGQIPKLLGTPSGGDTFFAELRTVFEHIGETNLWTLALGLACLATLLLLKRYAPRVPAMLLVVIASIVIVTVFNLTQYGVEVLGAVDTKIPLPAIPSFTFSDVATLLPGVIALSLIGYAESNTVTEEFANEHHYDIQPNQELRALGMANIFSGLFKGFIVAGGASQSAANDKAGAKSQISGLIVSGLVVLTAIFLMPLFSNLPQAALGAIVISAVIGFINVPALRRIWHLRRDSFWLAMAALFGVILFGVLPGLLLAVFLSFGILLVWFARPSVSELGQESGSTAYVSLEHHSEAQTIPGMLILRLDAPLIAINAQAARIQFRDQVRAAPSSIRVVLFDMEMTTELDIESIDKLADMQRELAADGIQLWLARVHKGARDMLERSGLAETIGRDRIFTSVADGAAAFKLL